MNLFYTLPALVVIVGAKEWTRNPRLVVNNMKAVGNWVIVEIEQRKSASGIISMHRNEGVCVSCDADDSIVGKKVIWSSKGRYEEFDNYLFIPYDAFLAVVGDD